MGLRVTLNTGEMVTVDLFKNLRLEIFQVHVIYQVMYGPQSYSQYRQDGDGRPL